MRESSDDFPAPFQRLLDRIKEAADQEAVGAALELSKQAISWGLEHGNLEAQDRARCNRASFLIARGQTAGLASELQVILMRDRRSATRFLAAYNLSILYDQRRLFDKSLFYARLALEHAQQTAVPDRILMAWNRIGNVQIIQSMFRDAHETYQRVVALLDPTPSIEQAVIGSNIGYCLLMLEETEAGLRKLIETRRLIIRLRLSLLEARIGLRLALCYAYIELGRFHLAQRHGLAALDQGEATDDPELTKKALYLLGEVAKKAGDDDLALDLFERLEATFHPEQVGLADLLMAVESHRLVNLRA